MQSYSINQIIVLLISEMELIYYQNIGNSDFLKIVICYDRFGK